MTNEKLIQATRSVSVETGSLVCLGCGHENNCGIHGCAILRAAADCIEGLSTQLADLQTRFDRVNDFEQFLNYQLAMGRRVLPMADCDNFDYQTGCCGHEGEEGEG